MKEQEAEGGATLNVSQHPIRVAAARAGLTPDLLRAWEKRYRAIRPQRTAGRRFYTDADIERLQLLRRTTAAGRRIGEVASLQTRQLRELAASDQQAATRLTSPAPRSRRSQRASAMQERAGSFLEASLEAIRDGDAATLETVLSRATVALPSVTILDDLIVPLLQRVGDRWRSGELRMAEEHLASAVVRKFLGSLESGVRNSGSAARLVVATPPGQHHELGAMIALATAGALGWSTTYLGPNLPVEEIAAMATKRGSQAVALSLIYPADDPSLGEELLRLRRLLTEDVAIIIGGQAAGGYQAAIREMDAFLVHGLPEFRDLLDSLRTKAVPDDAASAAIHPGEAVP